MCPRRTACVVSTRAASLTPHRRLFSISLLAGDRQPCSHPPAHPAPAAQTFMRLPHRIHSTDAVTSPHLYLLAKLVQATLVFHLPPGPSSPPYPRFISWESEEASHNPQTHPTQDETQASAVLWSLDIMLMQAPGPLHVLDCLPGPT